MWKGGPDRRNSKGEDLRQSGVSQALNEGRQEWGDDNVTVKELVNSSQDFGFWCGRGGRHGGLSAEERCALT